MTWYLQLNMSVALFGVLAMILTKMGISSLQKNKIHILLLLLSVAVIPTMKFIPEQDYIYLEKLSFQAPYEVLIENIKVITTNSFKFSHTEYSNVDLFPYLFLVIVFIGIGLLLMKTKMTLSEINGLILYKKINNVRVLISENKISPYSFSFFGQSYVVIPEFLISQRQNLKYALMHEFQHLRNKDTFWVYTFELLIIFCFLNPILYRWRRQFLMNQEFACDEALITHKKVSAKAYATCLVQVAEITNSYNMPFGATGMVWGIQQPQLLRRVIKMKNIKNENKFKFNALIVLCLICFAGSVFALQTSGNKISISEVERVFESKDFSNFPIDINEKVLEQLNHFLNKSRWRGFAQKSLVRYEDYKVLIDTFADKHRLPRELAAIAFVESGFMNLPSRKTSISSIGAGVWQFIPQTAKRFGLKVNSKIDERLNISKATEAALKYVALNNSQFKDLRLAIMSYYAGENRVRKDIQRFKTRDPWVLIEKGNYKAPYLARVMAAALIIKYPDLVN